MAVYKLRGEKSTIRGIHLFLLCKLVKGSKVYLVAVTVFRNSSLYTFTQKFVYKNIQKDIQKDIHFFVLTQKCVF